MSGISVQEKPAAAESAVILPKDYIETPEGLLLAVVAEGTEDGRVACYLRYRRDSQGRLQKLASNSAARLLQKEFPAYLYDSRSMQSKLPGIPRERIARHYSARRMTQQLLQLSNRASADSITSAAAGLLSMLVEHGLPDKLLGLTGSLLIGAQNATSDIDLVLYDRKAFFRARRVVAELTDAGLLDTPSEAMWRESFSRRGAVSLEYSDYCWHEQRKMNKGLHQGYKFDLSLYAPGADRADWPQPVSKAGAVVLRLAVSDAEHAYDFPACYLTSHPRIKRILSFTATYAGQALAGEEVEVAGMMETCVDGSQQVVIGNDREATGQYIRVCSR